MQWRKTLYLIVRGNNMQWIKSTTIKNNDNFARQGYMWKVILLRTVHYVKFYKTYTGVIKCLKNNPDEVFRIYRKNYYSNEFNMEYNSKTGKIF